MSGKPDTRTPVDLLDHIHDGRVRLPEFQREFNWVRSARIALLDSIQKDYPVSTLLFLEVSPEYAAWRVRPLSARYAYIWSDGICLGAS